MVFRRNAYKAFRTIGIGYVMLVRREISFSNISKTVCPRTIIFYRDIHTDIVYNQTGYDVIIYFRSEVIAKKICIKYRRLREEFIENGLS